MRRFRVLIIAVVGFFLSCFIFGEKNRERFRVRFRYSYAKILSIYFLKLHLKKIISKEIVYKNREIPVDKLKRPVWPRVVYTCITGLYDKFPIHGYYDSRYDYVCFTDNQEWIEYGSYGGWKILPLQFSDLDHVRNSRWHKIHPEILFPDYSGSIWIDGSLLILNEIPFLYFDLHFLRENLISVSRHPEITSIYEEAELVVSYQRDVASVVNNQIDKIIADGFPFPQVLPHFETGILLRMHNDESIVEFNRDWWDYVSRCSFRDQLSFDFIAWKNRVHVSDLFDAPIEFFRRTAIAHVLHGENKTEEKIASPKVMK